MFLIYVNCNHTFDTNFQFYINIYQGNMYIPLKFHSTGSYIPHFCSHICSFKLFNCVLFSRIALNGKMMVAQPNVSSVKHGVHTRNFIQPFKSPQQISKSSLTMPK